jgi:hypothetical protein
VNRKQRRAVASKLRKLLRAEKSKREKAGPTYPHATITVNGVPFEGIAELGGDPQS